MQYTPKEVWQIVCVVSGGDTSRYALPTIKCMCLPKVKLATTDAEIASIFCPHFDRIFSNHRPIDWTLIYRINQRYGTEELYPTI